MAKVTDTSISTSRPIQDLFRGAFSNRPGMVIGEGHYARAQYKIMIDNMSFFTSECGVSHIASEVFLMEDKAMLDRYFDSKGSPESVPIDLLKDALNFDIMYRQGVMFSDKFDTPDFLKNLEDYLEHYFLGVKDGVVMSTENASSVFKDQKEVFDGLILNEFNQPYNILHLLIEAKRHNVRIVGIDTNELRNEPEVTGSMMKRMELLPNAAKQVLQNIPGHYIVHTGAAHSYLAKNVDRKPGAHVYGMGPELGNIRTFNIIESHKIQTPMEISHDVQSMFMSDHKEPFWEEIHGHANILINPEKVPLEVGGIQHGSMSPKSIDQISTIHRIRNAGKKLLHGITTGEKLADEIDSKLSDLARDSYRLDMLMQRIAEAYLDFQEGKILPFSSEVTKTNAMKEQALSIAREKLHIETGSPAEKPLLNAMKGLLGTYIEKEQKQRDLHRLV